MTKLGKRKRTKSSAILPTQPMGSPELPVIRLFPASHEQHVSENFIDILRQTGASAAVITAAEGDRSLAGVPSSQSST